MNGTLRRVVPLLALGATIAALVVVILALNWVTGLSCLNHLSDCLADDLGLGDGLGDFIGVFVAVIAVATFPLLVTIILIWVERKFAARIQDRMGPNRVGPFGLLQPLADVVKLLGKENITPVGADKWIYNAAPVVMVMSVLLIWAVVPFTKTHVGIDLEIGALYFVAVASISTLAIIMAGWASNNKYALLGAFRVVAMLISYEVPLALALLAPVMLAGSMSMVGIVEAQYGMWFVVSAPVSAFLFFISSQAETGRAPFDLLEAESEIIAGYNIEYSGMKFAMFFAGEFMHVFTNGVLMAVLFTGGWLGPGAEDAPLLALIYLMVKASFWYLASLLLRNTLPRLRIDQVMAFNWKFLVPISIANILMIAFLLKIVQEVGIAPDPQDAHDFVANIPQTLVLLAGNLALFGVIMNVVRNQIRQEREAREAFLNAKSAGAPAPAAGD